MDVEAKKKKVILNFHPICFLTAHQGTNQKADPLSGTLGENPLNADYVRSQSQIFKCLI